jgi:iron complex transport system substrate-binding protein
MAAAAAGLPRRPRVFFEEWDVPHISAIRWVSELLAIAGGDDCFPELALQSLGKDRIIADPVPRSCGAIPTSSSAPGAARSFAEKVAARPGWQDVAAVRGAAVRDQVRPTSCSPARPR